ncbi:hypothetical protein BP6252_04506 [Coleophoma cylindrospora]|uniref:Interferon-induced GTP-binding protein Mx n=1 Tax=Coleophoma cylindrospora TaxID=1849047 RepID=A0A3D8S0S3_9HELO|nr:hypothetical protein BP6252_04506 [Coleophoma cylindrospora]
MDSVKTTGALEGLQSYDQRRVLDVVSQVRKCGLESELALPQIVVCGDQSAGKSSVLEALTEIPFPRNDNLCTRFATEIILRRAATTSLTIKVIPDHFRPPAEQATIRLFQKTITDFDELENVMNDAKEVMGLTNAEPEGKPRAFARDILSIEIEGPSRPQLTVVDIPGLIHTSTRGVSTADVDTVMEITDYYISQSRTICLAVVSATNDYANQKILQKVRDVDPQGERTLGIITKPDRLPAGSDSEKSFIELADNQDVFFKLGWHVLKNRGYEDRDSSFEERNLAESNFFRKSNFKQLPADSLGIDALRTRLSDLLFEHIKRELPQLRKELASALKDATTQLNQMGKSRSNTKECRDYLLELSTEFWQICKAAINGHYEGEYFLTGMDAKFSACSSSSLRRTRAIVQYTNTAFANVMRTNGYKYKIGRSTAPNNDSTPHGAQSPDEEGNLGFEVESERDDESEPEDNSEIDGESSVRGKSGAEDSSQNDVPKPVYLNKKRALQWVRDSLIRNRGKELIGNFNPLLIGELFWEQASHWQPMAESHVDSISEICLGFLQILLEDLAPKDVEERLWDIQMLDALRKRREAAGDELAKIMEDLRNYPINYNHYYTDTIKKSQDERKRALLQDAIAQSTSTKTAYQVTVTDVDVEKALSMFQGSLDPDMENFSCEQALDCLFAIYKVQEKVFVANVTTQVIERHLVRDLEKIFSPIAVNQLTDAEVEAIASEPDSAKRRREFLQSRIAKLEEGREIFKGVAGKFRS